MRFHGKLRRLVALARNNNFSTTRTKYGNIQNYWKDPEKVKSSEMEVLGLIKKKIEGSFFLNIYYWIVNRIVFVVGFLIAHHHN